VQRVTINPNNRNQFAVKISNPPTTTLTGFFELCKVDPFAKTLLYVEVPFTYT